MEHNTQKHIRNFVILAHIDHGKSTLADRFLEITRTVENRVMQEQYLDQMDLERERGITIKMQPVYMTYTHNNQEYYLNLIDTPGHVDFSYEVSRALVAVEGGILLVDATQGVQAQTVAHLQTALESGTTIIPVLNKIDLPHCNADAAEQELLSLFENFDYIPEKVHRISAKTGEGVEQVLESVVEHLQPPAYSPEKLSRALVFDSSYDDYQGVIAHIRVVDGAFSKNDKICFMQSGAEATTKDIGVFLPVMTSKQALTSGDIGYIATGLKNIELARVGDTITLSARKAQQPISGYKEPDPLVFSTIFPTTDAKYEDLHEGIGKLKLNDSSLFFEQDYSSVLGRGIKAGFLGMLHMEIVLERLKREHNLDLIISSPCVAYQLETTTDEIITVRNPSQYPDPSVIKSIQEPWVILDIIVPTQYLNNVMQLLKNTRGEYNDTKYIGMDRVQLYYDIPLSDIISHFYNDLKNVSSGFGSVAYTMNGYREADIVKLDILLAGDKVEVLSRFVPRVFVETEARKMVEKIKDTIKQEQFAVAIQAAIGGKVIARATKSATRKNVTAGLYGGDFSRKKKQLEKQKRGKKRLEKFGKINLDSESLIKIFQ